NRKPNSTSMRRVRGTSRDFGTQLKARCACGTLQVAQARPPVSAHPRYLAVASRLAGHRQPSSVRGPKAGMAPSPVAVELTQVERNWCEANSLLESLRDPVNHMRFAFRTSGGVFC